MLRRLLPVLAVAGLAAAALPAAPAAAAPQTLRLDGIGPLKLGMTRGEALKTGWLAGRRTGCKLGGKPYPLDYTYTGDAAPDGVTGFAEFTRNKLTVMTFVKGVKTEAGVTVGKTRITKLVSAYEQLGFDASSAFDETFGGTFALVKDDGGDIVLSAFGRSKTVQEIGIPQVPTCE